MKLARTSSGVVPFCRARTQSRTSPDDGSRPRMWRYRVATNSGGFSSRTWADTESGRAAASTTEASQSLMGRLFLPDRDSTRTPPGGFGTRAGHLYPIQARKQDRAEGGCLFPPTHTSARAQSPPAWVALRLRVLHTPP